jgi:hypothetical protein
MVKRGVVTGTLVTTLLAVTLGCAGNLGPGPQLTSIVVADNQPFSMSWTETRDTPRDLWMTYDLTWQGHTWDVLGPVTVRVNGEVVDRFHMTFHTSGSPTTRGGMRYEITSSKDTINGVQTGSGHIWLAELPAAPVGSTVEVSGKWNAQPGTSIQRLQVAVHE